MSKTQVFFLNALMRCSAASFLCLPGGSLEAAFYKEDHRYAEIVGWHRPGEDYLSPCGTWRSRQAAGEEVYAEAAAGVHGEPSDFADLARIEVTPDQQQATFRQIVSQEQS